MTDLSRVNLIAIHGNGGGGFRFSLLETQLNLIAPDLPGFEGGESLRDLASYADFIQQLVLDQEGDTLLLGTGIGGSLVLEYLQHYPEFVKGAILHAPVGARLERRWFPRLMSLPGVAPLVKYLISSSILRPLWVRLFFQNGRALPKELLSRFFAAYRKCSAFVPMFDWITSEWWQGLEPTSVPAVLLWGGQERMLKVDQVADFQALLPNSEVRIVDHWDHFPMLEQAKEFSQEIERLAEGLLS